MTSKQQLLYKYLIAIAQPFNRQRWLTSSLAILLCTLGYGVQSVQAEGSRSLYPSGATGSRANTEWANNTYGPASNSLLRRTLLKVYANTGEYILVGSSAVGVGSGNILIYNPNRVTGRIGNETIPATADFSCSAQRTLTGTIGLGQITSRALELAGPRSIAGTGNLTGYIPCFYQAPSTGIYDVVIYGPSGSNAAANGGPTGEIDLVTNASNFDTAQNASIAAWDVTVRSTITSTTDINGRLFTYYLSLFTGGNGRPINSSIFPITTDGYRYRTDLRGLDPNGFVVYGNQQGFLDSDGQTPLYHDVLGNSGGAQLTSLEGGTNLALPQYPIFFNQAESSVISFLGIPLIPTLPTLTNPVFSGTITSNTSRQNTGGTFSFSNNVLGNYILVISRDGTNFDPTNPNNRLLRGTLTTTGSQSIAWDGRDNSGTFFPVGQNYQVRLRINAGEYHFPLLDAENSPQGGPTFNLLNATNPLGSSVGFYDDRGYRTIGGTTVGTVGSVLCGVNPPTTASSDFFNGFDSGSNQRAFGSTGNVGNTNTPCSGSFGDVKGLDVWTYYPSNTASVTFNIVAPDLTITKTHTGNFTRGGSGTYTLTATNSGGVDTTGTVTVSDTLPTGLTPTAAIGTGWNCTISGQVVTCTRSDALAANISYPPITLTVNVALTASASITNTAIVSGGGQSNTTNDSVNDSTTIGAVPPNLLLVKRITQVAGTSTTGFNDLTTGSKAADDNNANWPTPLATYLRGLLNGGTVSPGNDIEYTIYFLNTQNPATNVTICDPIPVNMTFVADGYNNASPRPTEAGALPTDTGIALGSNATILPVNPTFYLTNANDSDRGRYYPPNDPSTPTACKRVDATGNVTATGTAANTDGAIVVNVVSGANQLPPATTAGNPTNSYGYIRFKARVK